METEEARRAAGAQYGVLTLAQARRCGMAEGEVRHLVRRGAWVRVHQGVFRIRELEDRSERGRLLSAVMAAQSALGPAAFASAETAARLWGLHGLPMWDGTVHMTLPATGTPYRIPGVRLYTWATEPKETVSRGRIRATRPGRTLRDVVLRVDRYTAVCLLDSALNQGLVRSGELSGLATANRARSGCRRSRPWWGLADGRAQSPLETRIRLVCADGGVPPDDLQHPFHDARGRLLAVGDLWWSDRRLLVEADGRAPHELPESLLRDRRRQNALELARPDVRIIRFTWADLACPNYILETVRGVGPDPNEPGSG
ncbi:type IV toxin-antitoxin system AbiEi family antitoxin domain-containing protein [Streptomonospora litoralis]|nr:type IV toxin-antitoxin system AbiEi family antitoxin domain-containing protein [Streptomonospora litoralis]